MSALDSVSSGSSPSASQFIPLGKTQRGWDAFQRLHKDDRPAYRPIEGDRPDNGSGKIVNEFSPQPLPNGTEASGFRPIKPGQNGFDDLSEQINGSFGFRPIDAGDGYKPRPLPQAGGTSGFVPIKPGSDGLADDQGSLVSRKDLFTGAELNPSVVQGKSVEAQELRASEAAQKLVANTLVEPILRQLRETNNAAAPFGPTDAEKQFGPILDAQIADKIVNAADFPLVTRIKQDLMKNSAYTAQATQAASLSYDLTNSKPLDILG
ncbi:MAG: hypothetical protein KC996_01960 [Phycisphaerales bacterium]|nr:hypothetical protein [Phycisphaerales bacterium]